MVRRPRSARERGLLDGDSEGFEREDAFALIMEGRDVMEGPE
jgi:hypothetical protein